MRKEVWSFLVHQKYSKYFILIEISKVGVTTDIQTKKVDFKQQPCKEGKQWCPLLPEKADGILTLSSLVQSPHF